MSCFHPNTLFYSTAPRGDGKLWTAFRSGFVGSLDWPAFVKQSGCDQSPEVAGFHFERMECEFVTTNRVDVPCGSCLGCRQAKARDWALRSCMELEEYGKGVFITLTFDPQHCPVEVSKRDVQLFMKRLRRRFEARVLRYLACGEYGELSGRPHYHLIVFGVGLSDLPGSVLVRSGNTPESFLYSSPTISHCWPYGFNSVAECTFNNCLYVARYGVKALATKREGFLLMSRRPGLGVPWIKANADKVVGNRMVYVGNRFGLLNNYLKSLVLEESEFERFARLAVSGGLNLADKLQAVAMKSNRNFETVEFELEDLAYKKLGCRVL